MEVQEFLIVQNGQALIALSPLSYFAVIAYVEGMFGLWGDISLGTRNRCSRWLRRRILAFFASSAKRPTPSKPS